MSQPKPNLRVNILDFSLVRSALASGKETLTDQNEFNSHFHSLKEISAVVPEYNSLLTILDPALATPFTLASTHSFIPWHTKLRNSHDYLATIVLRYPE